MNKIVIDGGNTVLCDVCNTDYTNSNDHGGFIWQKKAVCPSCDSEMRAKLSAFQENKYIINCPEHLSFRDWILTFRKES